MDLAIKSVGKLSADDSLVLLSDGKTKWSDYGLSAAEAKYIDSEHKKERNHLIINHLNRWINIYFIEKKSAPHLTLEECRRAGQQAHHCFARFKTEKVIVVDTVGHAAETLALVEGMALSNYQFLRYRKNPKDKNDLRTIGVHSKKVTASELETLNILVDATCRARDLVNTPVFHLNAVQLAKEFQKLGKEAGFRVEVFNKSKIASLKMGGLLAVNYGSVDPPTFSVMEYKPKGAKNKQPIVLVGKGVVYDTGGLSLKPTGNSMDYMKSDMAGAAAVACTLFAIAKAKLPVHVIALVPATDNRPSGNAITPGDVITMHNGLTVEVLNTDAEGRLILGDALSFAQQFKPELVIDLATLTGAAVAAVGTFGIVCMGTADEKTKDSLKASGDHVYERLAEFPFWDEYDDLIKSDIADIKNVGGPYGGSITAGKFLQRFVKYPWMHFDIAGPSFLHGNSAYRVKGGTGVGVRLLFDFLSKRAK